MAGDMPLFFTGEQSSATNYANEIRIEIQF